MSTINPISDEIFEITSSKENVEVVSLASIYKRLQDVKERIKKLEEEIDVLEARKDELEEIAFQMKEAIKNGKA